MITVASQIHLTLNTRVTPAPNSFLSFLSCVLQNICKLQLAEKLGYVVKLQTFNTDLTSCYNSTRHAKTVFHTFCLFFFLNFNKILSDKPGFS